MTDSIVPIRPLVFMLYAYISLLKKGVIVFFVSQDGVMVLSATHRYKKKYVTTLLYKPIWWKIDFIILPECFICTPSVQNIQWVNMLAQAQDHHLLSSHADLKIITRGSASWCVTTDILRANSHLDVNIRLS